MPAPLPLPAGVSREPLLAVLRQLAWEAADILLAYARGGAFRAPDDARTRRTDAERFFNRGSVIRRAGART